MDQFFVLEPAEGHESGEQWATADPLEPIHLGGRQKCPICGQNVSDYQWLPPQRVHLSRAKAAKWGDFIWVNASSLMVSARFKHIYLEEGLTGISRFSPPVEIVRVGSWKPGQFPATAPEYHLAQVLWGGANLDDSASGLVFDHPQTVRCSYCRTSSSGRHLERIVLEPGSWNGRDIFIPRNAAFALMVSEKFRQAALDHQLTNAMFIPAAQYAYDSSRWGKWYVNPLLEPVTESAAAAA